MERAATQCAIHILDFQADEEVVIFCGPGNNGGDGLAIARILWRIKGIRPRVILLTKGNGSADYQINLKKWLAISQVEYFDAAHPPEMEGKLIIDALFGSGLNRPLEGIYKQAVELINQSNSKIISIDIPSGLLADSSIQNNTAIQADETLTFQCLKLAFLMPEIERYSKKITVINIHLNKTFEQEEPADWYLTEESNIRKIYQPRSRFANKGTFGYAALFAGSYGMMGAAVLSARGCLRSGVGKLACIVPEEGYTIMQSAVPEALCKVSGKYFLSEHIELDGFNVLGIGPGIGDLDEHRNLLSQIFERFRKPVVIDADALNVISQHKELLEQIPSGSIITPHPKEFDRLFGKTDNHFERCRRAIKMAGKLQINILLKGRYTLIAAPDGKGYFNATGNAGMATGGSGDVLTGMITGLLAQNYSPLHAAILGAWLHGLAGDLAAQSLSEESLIAGDLIDFLGKAFLQILT